MSNPNADLPFWQVNVPPEDRSPECPPYLLNLSAKDRSIISTPDSDFRPQTWPQVIDLVRSNHLELFQRKPSELRRYRAYVHGIQERYGSVAKFILDERLRWEAPVVARGGDLFADECDYKILRNDWPYGIDERIVHLVVWTKFSFGEDSETGDLSGRARQHVDDFVSKTFRSHMPQDQVIWFKNWAALKSVHAVEHFHVMLLDPSPDFVRNITNGDVPSCNRADV